MKKQCGKCKEEKDVKEFYKNKSCKDGLQRKCKKCSKLIADEQGLRRKHKREKEIEEENKIIKRKKKCSKCEKELLLEHFHKCKDNKSGLYSSCKACVNGKPLNRIHVKKEKIKIFKQEKVWKKSSPKHYPNTEDIWIEIEGKVNNR